MDIFGVYELSNARKMTSRGVDFERHVRLALPLHLASHRFCSLVVGLDNALYCLFPNPALGSHGRSSRLNGCGSRCTSSAMVVHQNLCNSSNKATLMQLSASLTSIIGRSALFRRHVFSSALAHASMKAIKPGINFPTSR